MMLRLSLFVAILAGIATIALVQIQTRKQLRTVITQRDENIKARSQENLRADKAEKTLTIISNTLAATAADLAQAQHELNSTRQQVAAATANIQKLDADLKSAIAVRKEAEQLLERFRFAGGAGQVAALQANLKTAESELASLRKSSRDLAQDVAYWKEMYRTATGNPIDVVRLKPGTRGEIVAVDPKWRFVVLNIGKDKDLLAGGVLMVHRDSQYIGKVRVAEVQDTRAIAHVVDGTQIGEIHERDRVVY